MTAPGRGDGDRLAGEGPDFVHRHKRLFAAAFVLTAGAMMPWSGGAFRYIGEAVQPSAVDGGTLAPDAVIDPANLFDADQKQRLTQRLDLARRKTGVDFAVITTRGLRGETLKAFTNRYHNGWWNSGNRRPGVIVMFSPSDRVLGISNSKSIGSAVDPLRRSVVSAMKPFASRGDFEGAAMIAIEQMEGRLVPPAPEQT